MAAERGYAGPVVDGSDPERADELDLVPVTDQIATLVRDAVDEVDRDHRDSRPSGPANAPDAPLELAELTPPPPLTELPMTDLERARRRRRWLMLLGAVLVICAVGAAFLGFTDAGRALLPPSLQAPAKTLADDVERRARDVADPAFYTFTDDEGVVHIVDSLEKVPPKYRERAEKKR